MITTSKRLDGIGEYYFSQKLREIDELNKQAKNIISLGIGSPDLPPHPDVIKVLQEESAKPNTHAYQSYKGSPVLRTAISQWYKTWYKVDLHPDTEILPLIGSKEVAARDAEHAQPIQGDAQQQRARRYAGPIRGQREHVNRPEDKIGRAHV